MLSLCYMHTQQSGKRGTYWPLLNMEKRYWLLQAVLEPLEVAVIHCKGHQKGDNYVNQGNALADRAATQESLKMALIPQSVEVAKEPHYTEPENEWAQQWGYIKTANRWWMLNHRIMLPMATQWKIIKEIHNSTHLGRDALLQLVSWAFGGKGLNTIIKEVIRSSPLCLQNNPSHVRPPPLLTPVQRRGSYPSEDWQVDFTNMPPTSNYRYLLVFIDTVTGWIEAFSTQTEKAHEVLRALLKDIVPRHGLPRSLQSENGPSFVYKMTQ